MRAALQGGGRVVRLSEHLRVAVSRWKYAAPRAGDAAPALSFEPAAVTIFFRMAKPLGVAMDVVVAASQQGVRCASSTFFAPVLLGPVCFVTLTSSVLQQQICCAPLFFLPAASAPVARSARRRVSSISIFEPFIVDIISALTCA